MQRKSSGIYSMLLVLSMITILRVLQSPHLEMETEFNKANSKQIQTKKEMQTKIQLRTQKQIIQTQKVEITHRASPSLQEDQHRNKTYHGRVFKCGYPIPMAEYMFPEYKFMGDSAWSAASELAGGTNNENDILVVGFGGLACNNGMGDEKTSFGGKILYVNGEPHGNPVSAADKQNQTSKNIYQIGPYPQNPKHSLQVYHAVMNFMNNLYLPTHRHNYIEFDGTFSKRNTNSGNTDFFDPWKQLVEGNGGKAFDEWPRIPAVVYLARNCVTYRQDAAQLLARSFRYSAVSGETVSSKEDEKGTLSEEKGSNNNDLASSFVHFGGACQVTGGIPVPPNVLEGWKNEERSKFQYNYKTIYTRYKYCLVMENTKKDGYVTEKLINALLGGCVPIYYGTRDVYKMFREDAFVYFDIKNPQPALDRIQYLENNHTEYLRITNRALPLLRADHDKDHSELLLSTATTVDDYFSLLPNIGTGKLCRKVHEMMGLPIPESLAGRLGVG